MPAAARMDASRAESVFLEAVQLRNAAERDAFLARACAGNPDLEATVRSLIQAHDADPGFLETRAMASPPQTPPHPPAPPTPATLSTPPEDAERRELRERRDAVQHLLETAPLAPSHPRPRAQLPLPDLPGFTVERPLGHGGLGSVFAATDLQLHRRVAIKILHAPGGVAVPARLVDEARKAAALDHPNIVTIFSVLADTRPPAIVMEYVEGFPIDRFAEQLTLNQKARLLRDVARGLAAAHARGLIHRDLKPDNILVGPDLRPRILDFGLAQTLDEAGRPATGFEGTPLYASPEQVRGFPLTAASDVFALGSLMFKVLTGRPPFPGQNALEVLQAIATTPPPFLRDVAVGVPEDLQAITLACLSWDPADRPDAATLVVELGRFLAGEPVRLRPRLYSDLLRQRIAEHAHEVGHWESQGIVSREERDQLQAVHRRLLADEDDWIIDARRITPAQTLLYTSTWSVVVAALLLVWLAREDLPPVLRWLAPAAATGALLGMGTLAIRRRETLAAASFLAGGALALVPTTLSLLKELGALQPAPAGVTQAFGDVFTNAQFAFACLAAFAISTVALVRLRMTGFAWTSTALGALGYLGCLLHVGWLDWAPYRQALACLPLALAEPVALAFERQGRVRWALPPHLLALVTLVAALDVIAHDGPTLRILGVPEAGYFNPDRLGYLSFGLNGLIFLGLMFVTARSASLDLRRASRLLEILALLHVEGTLFLNASQHRQDPQVGIDVTLHLAAAAAFLALGAILGRWRMLVGALGGLALGSYLLVDLQLIPRTPFVLALGSAGLGIAAAAFYRILQNHRLRPRRNRP